MSADWSIWSFCYAMGKLPYDFLSGSPINSNRGTVDVPMLVTLLKSTDGRLVLVDTGFASGASMTGRGFANFVRSDELLSNFGFDPLAVETLMLTHLHFDHAGNLAGFPNARIYVQRYEYDAWKRVIDKYGKAAADKGHWAFSSLNLADFDVLDEAIAQGRVEFLEGDAPIAPGLTCRLARDTHTFGSQWLEIETAQGSYALAGDCCYTFENLRRMWPPGYTQGNAWNMIESFEQMKQVAGPELERLIPGHDIQLFDHYRSGQRENTRFMEIHLAQGHASLLA